MTTVQNIYQIQLENYNRPRYESALRSYYGDRDELAALMTRIENIQGAKDRYSETINAFDYYGLEDDMTHTIAGQEVPILSRVQEICSYHTTLHNQSWDFITHEGGKIPCCADKVDVTQMLIATETGYERCIRATFTGLLVYRHSAGWFNPGAFSKGFPGMVIWDGVCHTVSLYITQAFYDPEELEEAIEDTVDERMICLEVAVADILGEG